MPLNFDNVTAICQRDHLPFMADNIFNSSYLFKQMKERRDVRDGGTSLVAPLLYAKGRGGHVAEWGQLDVRPKETRTAAQFEWRQSYANMTISSMQQDKVNGDKAVLNLIDTEMKIAEKTLADILSTALYNTGNDSDAPHGLRHMINVNRSLGGIDSTTYTWWDAIVASDYNSNYTTTNLTEANLTNPSSDYYYLTLLSRTWNRCIHKGEHPDGVYVSRGMFEIYEDIVQPYQTFPYSKATQNAADAGFQVLEYKGVPFIYDEYCPAGFTFMTNTEYLGYKVLSKDNFKMGAWKEPVDGLQKTSQITVKSQFFLNNSMYQGRIEAAPAIG